MPRSLTDQELLASFTPLEREFHAWYEENSDELSKLARGARADYIDRKWSDPVERKQYTAWSRKWLGRHEERMLYRFSPREFVDLVNSTNFSNSDSAGQFLFTMEMLNMPFVILGESEFGGVFTCYGLKPGPAYLWPNVDDTNHDGTLMDRNVLGINTNVHVEYRTGEPSPRKHRLERSSGEESTRTTTSDDINLGGGFVFAQLGALYAFAAGDWRIARRQKNIGDIIRGPWEATGFAVVVRLDPRGRPGPVYIIYNFYRDRCDDGDDSYGLGGADHGPRRVHVPVVDEFGLPLPHIGRLHKDCSNMFTVARISNRLSHLGVDKRFPIDVESCQECQIVRAKIWSVGQECYLLRQFVRADM